MFSIFSKVGFSTNYFSTNYKSLKINILILILILILIFYKFLLIFKEIFLNLAEVTLIF